MKLKRIFVIPLLMLLLLPLLPPILPTIPPVKAEPQVPLTNPTPEILDIFEMNWTEFWSELNENISWKATPKNEDLQVIKEFPEPNICKVTLDLTASLPAVYTITFKIDQEFMNWEVIDDTTILLNYDSYEIKFNFSDVEDMRLQHSHSTTGKKFVFHIQKQMEEGENLYVDPVIDTTPIYDDATQFIAQSKSFRAQDLFWAFWCDSTNFKYSTSENGTSWASFTTLRSGVRGQGLSTWNNETHVAYAWGRYPESTDIKFRLGALNTDGTISWVAAEQTATGSYNRILDGCNIVRNSDGEFFIGFVNGTPWALPMTTYLTRNDNTDGTWSTTSGFPKVVNNTGAMTHCSMSSLNNGDIYMTYAAQSQGPVAKEPLRGVLWDESEGTLTTELISGATFQVSEGWTQGSIADSNNKVYAIYRGVYVPDGTVAYVYFQQKQFPAGSWSDPVQLGIMYRGSGPTVALSESENYVYALWARNHTATANNIDRMVAGSYRVDTNTWESVNDTLITLVEENSRIHGMPTGVYATDALIGVLYTYGVNSPENVDVRFVVVEEAIFRRYEIVGHSSVVLGEPCTFYAKLYEVIVDGQWIFGTNNTGTWMNDTAVEYNGELWSNVTKTLTSQDNTRVEYQFWAWNSTYTADSGLQYLTTSITETYNYGVTITNMEGCGNWVFSASKYYNFFARYGHSINYTYLDNVRIAFSDGVHWLNVSYDNQASTWSIDNGEDYINLQKPTVSVSGVQLNVTFPIYFESTILDSLNVNISMWSNDTVGFESEWEVKAVDYFNIYNLGGHANYTLTGSGGRTVGGDAYEIYAGGEYGANIFDDNFESGELIGWSIYTPNSTYNYVEVQDRYFFGAAGYHKAMHIVDAGAYTTYAAHGFRAQTGTFTFQAQIFPVTAGESLSVQLRTLGDDNPGPWIEFRDDGKIYFVNYTSPYDYYIQDYVGNTWYNLTLVVDVTSDTYDIYVEETLKNSTVSFYVAKTSINEVRFTTYMGGVPTTEASDIYVDDIKIYVSSVGGHGGTAEVTITYRKLQHFHTQFAISIPGGIYELHYPDEGYVEFSIDYCIDDTWIESGWKVRINITDAWIATSSGFLAWGGAKNWIELEISWYNRGEYVTGDKIYTFFEGGPGDVGTIESDVDRFRLWVDLWFNTVNASTTVGGRVSSFYYGVSDEANVIGIAITGSEWKYMVGDGELSDYFHDLEDGDGNIISSTQIKMMRVRAKVWRSENYDIKWVLKDFKLLNHERAVGDMKGIETPIPHETQKPALYTGGFFEALALSFKGIIDVLGYWLGPSILGFWTVFVGFLDTLFDWAGWPGGFTQIINAILSAVDWFGVALLTLYDWMALMIPIFQGMTDNVSSLLTILGQMITSILQVIPQMLVWLDVAIVDSGLGELFYFSLILISITLPFLELVRMEEKGFGILFEDVDKIISILAFFIDIGHKFVNFLINLVSRLIGMIPGI